MLGQLRKSCGKIVSWGKVVCSWKSSELESTESCEKASRPQPNSVFAQFSVVCMFNWILGQLKKGCGKIVCSWKSSELESAEQCEGKSIKPHPRPNSVFAQFSVVCMFNWMLGRLRKAVGRSCLEGVCSWKSSESESVDQREGKEIKSRSQFNLVFAQFLFVCMFNWMLGQLRKAIERSYVRERTPNLNRLSRARQDLALSPIQCSRNSQSCVCSIGCSANWGRL